MHHGVFKGVNSSDRARRILILGESHHISKTDKDNMEAGKPATYTTSSVVNAHIKGINTSSLEFFRKIGKSFGYKMETEEDRESFWSNVYFGNYIEVLCGIKDSAAKRILKEKKGNKTNRETYNDTLFKFVNDNGIDIVVCFGRLVFDNLPSLNRDHFDEENPKKNGKIKEGIKIGKSNDYIGKCIYLPNIDHKNTKVILEKRLEAYSLRHPSAAGGYNPENYVDVLKKLL